MRIPKEKIEEVRAASDVVDVVGDYVQLKKKGANYFGLCPFHAEKTPSFSVNPSLGIYKCFGCGVAGDVFEFVMAIEQATFIEAVRTLAEKAGIALPEGEVDEDLQSEADAIYHALRFAARFYYRCLTAEARGNAALAYLKEREFEPATIKRFGLGFAPDAWDALLKAAGAEHISEEILEKAGLILPRKEAGGFYDRFRNRLIFPIISHMGKVLGFGARILVADPKQPKYINSPETSVYHKGSVLYGLYQARRAVRQEGEVVLVEGYTDVMALHQAGVENVVASSGTALTLEQVRLLGRYAQRVVLLYDADAAGEAASLRGVERILEAGLAAYAVALPSGQDPDSFVRESGGGAFRAYVQKHRQDFVAFQYDLAKKEGRLDTPEGEAEAVGQILQLITTIEDPLAQETYLQRVSEVSGMPQTTVSRAFEQRRRRQGNRPASAPREQQEYAQRTRNVGTGTESRQAKTVALPGEETMIRLMLEHGDSMIEFVLGHMSLNEFTEGPAKRGVEAILSSYESGRFEAQALLGSVAEDELKQFLLGVLTDRESPSENWTRKLNIIVPRLNEDEYKVARDAMVQVKVHRVVREMDRVRGEIYAAQQAQSDSTGLQRELNALQDLRKQIERQEFINLPEAASGRSNG